MSRKKQGYEPGKGRTFTPSLRADWTDEFTATLNSHEGWSRNRLTEHYIKLGMEAEKKQRGKHITVYYEELTEKQIEFIEDQNGKEIMLNLLSALTGEGGLGVAISTSPARDEPATEKRTEQVKEDQAQHVREKIPKEAPQAAEDESREQEPEQDSEEDVFTSAIEAYKMLSDFK